MYGNQRVLFVTTDQALMRRVPELLGAESGRWQPLFAPTSDRAWWELVQGPIEAVVWDRQLEGLEVAQFLARVREGFPRIGLLALAPVSTVIAGRGWSGSYGLHELPRHCDAATLVSQLDRAVDLQQILTQERLRSLIGDLRRLPSVPRTYWDLVDAASRPTTGLSEIARIVQCDPAMSLKVLQLVNSAFFGLAQRVTSIQKAVSYLGLDLLKGIVLTAHTFAAFDTMGVESFSIEQFQLCSIRVARLAQKFVPDRMLAEEIFTSALLHDIGELVLAVVEPEKSAAVTERVAKAGDAMDEVEREIIGATHSDVGAFLLNAWRIPLPVVECVAFHHEPSRLRGGPRSVVAAVHAADALVGILTCGDPETRLDIKFLEEAGFGKDLPHWRALVREEAQGWAA